MFILKDQPLRMPDWVCVLVLINFSLQTEDYICSVNTEIMTPLRCGV